MILLYFRKLELAIYSRFIVYASEFYVSHLWRAYFITEKFLGDNHLLRLFLALQSFRKENFLQDVDKIFLS